jgi:hypothetical protein
VGSPLTRQPFAARSMAATSILAIDCSDDAFMNAQ